jgi:ATP-binding cassette subfamily G (WHITE) protein 2 (SNQ2)
MLLAPFTVFQKFNASRHKQRKTIIQGFTGRLNPGEMLLVLGRPGSGCSTFLKTLANDRATFDNVEGNIDYDGFSPADVARDFAGDLVYMPEEDVHFPTLTVQQTLDFAARCKAPAKGARIPGRTREDSETLVREICLTLFGLGHTRNTKVGNESIRGVSGGERKRVSIAEATLARPKIGCFDNSTKGLDSATSLDYVRSLRTFTELLGSIAVSSSLAKTD